MTAITMSTLTAARLVAGHVNHLWQQWADEDLRGCCNRCCAPCAALKDLYDRGQLDRLYGVYVDHVGDDHSPWDPERRQIDRAWLNRAWTADLGCHEESATTEPSSKQPCPEGFHWIGQSFAHCDKCGLPAWDHEGMASQPEPPNNPFDPMPDGFVLRPWKAAELRACRRKWDPNWTPEDTA